MMAEVVGELALGIWLHFVAVVIRVAHRVDKLEALAELIHVTIILTKSCQRPSITNRR